MKKICRKYFVLTSETIPRIQPIEKGAIDINNMTSVLLYQYVAECCAIRFLAQSLSYKYNTFYSFILTYIYYERMA